MNFRILKKWRLLLGCFVLFWAATTAQANHHVIDRGWVVDPDGELSLQAVQQLPEKKLSGNLFGSGYSNATFWIRLHIDPANFAQTDPNQSLIIKIRPAYQDRVWLFDPLSPDQRERVTGDFVDWSNDEWQSLNLGFVVPLGSAPRDVWLKLKTYQALYTMIDVLTEPEAKAADRRQETWSTFYMALLLFVLAWSALTWLRERDPLIGWFAIRTFCATIYVFALLGYVRMFASNLIPPIYLDAFFNFSQWFLTAAALLFDSKLLEEFKANRWLVKAIRLLTLALPIELIAFALGDTGIGVRINYYIIVVALLLVFITTLSTRAWKIARHTGIPKPVVPKPVFVGLYSIGLLILVHNRLAILGLIPAPDNLLDYAILYPLPITILMMLLLQLRSYRLRKVCISRQIDELNG